MITITRQNGGATVVRNEIHSHAGLAKVTVSAEKPVAPVVGEIWVPEG